MEGDFARSPHAGIIPRSIDKIFEYLEANATEFTVRISFIELYNEVCGCLRVRGERLPARAAAATHIAGRSQQLEDLLASTTGESETKLRIMDDSAKGVVVHGQEEMLVRSASEVFGVMGEAVKRRRTAETKMNKSSRRVRARASAGARRSREAGGRAQPLPLHLHAHDPHQRDYRRGRGPPQGVPCGRACVLTLTVCWCACALLCFTVQCTDADFYAGREAEPRGSGGV